MYVRGSSQSSQTRNKRVVVVLSSTITPIPRTRVPWHEKVPSLSIFFFKPVWIVYKLYQSYYYPPQAVPLSHQFISVKC